MVIEIRKLGSLQQKSVSHCLTHRLWKERLFPLLNLSPCILILRELHYIGQHNCNPIILGQFLQLNKLSGNNPLLVGIVHFTGSMQESEGINAYQLHGVLFQDHFQALEGFHLVLVIKASHIMSSLKSIRDKRRRRQRGFEES